jgi:hypothetical protein
MREKDIDTIGVGEGMRRQRGLLPLLPLHLAADARYSLPAVEATWSAPPSSSAREKDGGNVGTGRDLLLSWFVSCCSCPWLYSKIISVILLMPMVILISPG